MRHHAPSLTSGAHRRRTRWSRAGWFASLTVLTTTVALAGPGGAVAHAGPIGTFASAAPVEAALVDELAASQTGEVSFWVVMEHQASLGTAAATDGWADRGAAVYDALTTTADATQVGLRELLTDRGAEFAPYWIVNAIQVTGDQALVDELAARPEVGEIVASRSYQIPDPRPAEDPPTVNAVEWGVDRIGAPDVWDTFGARGEGIVVGVIDTGGQFDHPALVDQYRGNTGSGFDHNYSWHDPSNVCGTPSLSPCDNHGHATHVTGTVLGDDGGTNQVGVAPGARWIAAKGCENNNCSDEALLSSGQFMLAPTDLNGENPRPDLRPHIVNNSWGGGADTDPWYQGIVESWVASGIFPQFANGNTNNGVAPCGSSSNPGNLPESYAAGAIDINDNLAGFSNRGPSAWGDLIKPNIAAPGVAVRSSVPGGGYGSASGTSMASPHVAGAVALIWSAAPDLAGDIDATRAVLDQTAIDTEDLTCGGTPENNNMYGQGRLDAFAAVGAALGVDPEEDPAIEVTPESLAAEQPAGSLTEQTLTIGNAGDADLEWSVFTDEAAQRLPSGATPVEAAGAAPEPAAGGVSFGTAPPSLGGVSSTTGEPAAVPAQDGDVTLTHSVSQDIVALNSVACTPGDGTTTDNAYLRHFVLSDFDITGEFAVTEVSFGVETINGPPHPVTVNLYTMTDPAGPFTYGNFDLVGTAQQDLSAQSGTIVTIPVSGVAGAGATLVVEVETPDQTGAGGGFFVGSNPAGQTAPSYLRSVECGLPEPADTATIGFPGMHIVMNVTGTTDVEAPVCGTATDIPWLSAAPASGTTAGGETSDVAVSFDATGLAPGGYEAVLCVASNDPASPLVQVPVGLTVTEGGGGEPVVCDETITGVHAGALTVSEGVTCLAAGAQVLGEVNVSGGAGLIATAAVIQGPVSAIGASTVELVFSQVTGPVLVSGATDGVSLFGSQVTGSVTLLSSTTPGAATVSGNTVIGSLSCFGNQPAPTDHGLSNTATGGKLGQCAEL
jgi:subtilisin family serine protease